jgi:predicted O-methyltransferase YrrM
MNVAETLVHLRSKGLTYCGRPGKLETLHRLAGQVEANGVAGVFLEAGVAMGGSASILAKTKSPDRELLLFDVFEFLPPPSAEDGDKAQQVYAAFQQGRAGTVVDVNYLTHAADLLSFTVGNLREVGVEPERDRVRFVKGLYQDTLVLDQPVAFAHIDCDWFESVNVCIDRIADAVSPGGVILFDDYHSFDGCRRAVDAWLARDRRFKVVHHDWTVAVERTPD